MITDVLEAFRLAVEEKTGNPVLQMGLGTLRGQALGRDFSIRVHKIPNVMLSIDNEQYPVNIQDPESIDRVLALLTDPGDW